MTDRGRFRPKTVYVIYIAATAERVWQALTNAEFSRQYFFGFAVEVEPRTGGQFQVLYPDGRVHIQGEVLDWSPPRRLSMTWLVEGMKDFGELPECLVTYDIEPSGESVKVTMTEAHSWDVPEAILSGGRAGWPKIMSSLKSVLETGRSLVTASEGPPPEMVEAVKRAVAGKPWLKERR
jgi:uncharacterized protein YndB with AHSA1/START domain